MDAGASFRRGAGGRSTDPPRIDNFILFPVNRTFNILLLLQKQHVTYRLRPAKITETPLDDLLK